MCYGVFATGLPRPYATGFSLCLAATTQKSLPGLLLVRVYDLA